MIESWENVALPQLHVNHLTIKMMRMIGWLMRWLFINAYDSSTNYAWTFSMFLRTLVIAEQEGDPAEARSPLEITLIWSLGTNQWVGGLGSTFGEGGSLNLAPAYANDLLGVIAGGGLRLAGLDGVAMFSFIPPLLLFCWCCPWRLLNLGLPELWLCCCWALLKFWELLLPFCVPPLCWWCSLFWWCGLPVDFWR